MMDWFSSYRNSLGDLFKYGQRSSHDLCEWHEFVRVNSITLKRQPISEKEKIRIQNLKNIYICVC